MTESCGISELRGKKGLEFDQRDFRDGEVDQMNEYIPSLPGPKLPG